MFIRELLNNTLIGFLSELVSVTEKYIPTTKSSSLTNYTRLHTHTRKEWSSLYSNVVKVLIIGLLIISFVVGIYFSVTDTSSERKPISVLFNNSLINTTLTACSYN